MRNAKNYCISHFFMLYLLSSMLNWINLIIFWRIYFGTGQLESDYYFGDSDFIFGIFLSNGDGIFVS